MILAASTDWCGCSSVMVWHLLYTLSTSRMAVAILLHAGQIFHSVVVTCLPVIEREVTWLRARTCRPHTLFCSVCSECSVEGLLILRNSTKLSNQRSIWTVTSKMAESRLTNCSTSYTCLWVFGGFSLYMPALRNIQCAAFSPRVWSCCPCPSVFRCVLDKPALSDWDRCSCGLWGQLLNLSNIKA